MNSSFLIRFLAGAIILSAAGCEVFPSDEPQYYRFTIVDETGNRVLQGDMRLEYDAASAEGVVQEIEGGWSNVLPVLEDRRFGSLGGHVAESGEVLLDFEMWRVVTDYNIELVGSFVDEERDVITGTVFYTTFGGRFESEHTFTVTRN